MYFRNWLKLECCICFQIQKHVLKWLKKVSNSHFEDTSNFNKNDIYKIRDTLNLKCLSGLRLSFDNDTIYNPNHEFVDSLKTNAAIFMLQNVFQRNIRQAFMITLLHKQQAFQPDPVLRHHWHQCEQKWFHSSFLQPF